jgi:hypothetical protein
MLGSETHPYSLTSTNHFITDGRPLLQQISEWDGGYRRQDVLSLRFIDQARIAKASSRMSGLPAVRVARV